MTLGENIKKIRLSQDFTQEEFAEIIGISRSYLGDLEKNRKNPSSETIRKIAKKLNVSTTYLLEGYITWEDIYILLKDDYSKGERGFLKGLFYRVINKARDTYNQTDLNIPAFENDNVDHIIEWLSKEIVSLLTVEINNADTIYDIYFEVLTTACTDLELTFMLNDISIEKTIDRHIEAVQKLDPFDSNYENMSIEEIKNKIKDDYNQDEIANGELEKDAVYHYFKAQILNEKELFIMRLNIVKSDYEVKLKELGIDAIKNNTVQSFDELKQSFDDMDLNQDN